jgi:hypothetical protein
LPFAPSNGGASAVVTCLCLPKNLPILLRGVDQLLQCAHCGNVYYIVKVEFDRQVGDLEPRVTVAYFTKDQAEALRDAARS